MEFRRSRKRRRVVMVSVLGLLGLAVLSLAAWAASSGGAGGFSPTGQIVAAQQQPAPPARADGPQSQAFAVLGKVAAAPPSDVINAFTRETTFAPNPALAVPIALPAGISSREAWLAPGSHSLCMYVPDQDGAATTCAATEDAMAGRLVMFLLRGTTQTIVGVAPDGVTDAHVMGTSIGAAIPVHNNLFAVSTTGANSVAVAGAVTAVPVAPKVTLPLPSATG